MRQMFVNKVKETEAELKEKEKGVRIDIIINDLSLKIYYLGLVLHCVPSSSVAS